METLLETLTVNDNLFATLAPKHVDYFERTYKQGAELEVVSAHSYLPDPNRDFDAFVLYSHNVVSNLMELAEENTVPPDYLAMTFKRLMDKREGLPEDQFLDFERKMQALME
jgi:hypothetical protein